MLAASLKGLLSYRGRLVSTILAIALGVGFVTGTMLFTDSMQASFTNTLTAQEKGVDVAVMAAEDLEGATGSFSSYSGVPAALAQRIAQVEGVAVAEGRMSGSVRLQDAQGKQLGRTGGSLSVASVATTPELRWMEATSGRVPATSGEIAVNDDAIESTGVKVGQKVQIALGETAKQFTIVGVFDPGASALSIGQGVVAIPRSDIQAVAGESTTYDRIDVVAAEGVAPEQLAASIDEMLKTLKNVSPEAGRAAAELAAGTFAAVTSEEIVQRAEANLATQLQLFQGALSAFAAIALFVAAYVINNTFTILITQRAKQLALMRCLGAKRGQVFRATVIEALVLGAVASLLGIGFGMGLVFGLDFLFGLLGVETGEVILRPDAVIVGVAVGAGMFMTLIGSVVPALRATRVSPLAAMRTTALSAATRPKLRSTILGVLMLAGGVAGLYLGMTGGEVTFSLGGAAFTFLGVVTLSPWIVGPLAHLLGLVGRFRVSGKLATENTVRNPKRTAATTGALVIGVTLMTVFVVTAESARVSALQQLEEEFPIDFAVTIPRGALPGDVKQQLSQAPQFAGLVEAREGWLDLNGEFTRSSGVDLEALSGPVGQSVDLGAQAGSLQELPGFNVGLSAELAKELGVTYGDALRVEGNTSDGLPKEFEVRVSMVYTNEIFGPAVFSVNTLHGLTGGQTEQATAFLKLADGAGVTAARDAINTALIPYRDATVQDRAGFVEDVTDSVNQVLALVGGLLGLAIIIALLGIANTLGLSVVERVRESAVLRALGLTRGQLRGMLATEAVLTSLIGAVMGLGLGLMFVYASLSAVGDVVTIAVPWLQVGAGLAGAIVVGLLASILPGRAAARTDIVRAMVTE